MIVKFTVLLIAAILFVEFRPISCAVANRSSFELTQTNGIGDNPGSELREDGLSTSAIVDPEPEPISFLSPELFTQPDPILYFVKLIGKISSLRAQLIGMELRMTLRRREDIPPRYLPYANVLLELLDFRPHLEDAKALIKEIQASSDSKDPDVLSRFLSPELSDLFSVDVFSDKELPSQLMWRLANLPEDRLELMAIELQEAFNKKDFPWVYYAYARDVWMLLSNRKYIPRLKKSICIFRGVKCGPPETTKVQKSVENQAGLVSKKIRTRKLKN